MDIHNGKIKQIVGGSLLDQGDFATENFVSEKDGTFYGKLYKENHLNGGHIIKRRFDHIWDVTFFVHIIKIC